jgi:acyl-CoA dehydrogenase
VFLDEVAVADADRIGDPGQGWPIARSVLALERGGGAGLGGGGSLGLGDPTALLELARRCGDPVARDRTMRVYVATEVARLTGAAAPGAKLRMAAVLKGTSGLALDLLGPHGMLDDGDWTTMFLTAPSLSIRGGTDEIQRSQIAERVLGLPREPSVDRDVAFEQLPR